MFTDQEHGVEAAAEAVEAALRGAGFEPERQDEAAGLADMFRAWAEIGLSQHDVAGLRERLAAWPRNARDADRESRTGNPGPGNLSEHGDASGKDQPPAVLN